MQQVTDGFVSSRSTLKHSQFVLTGILDLDGGVGLRVWFMNNLSTDLLCQNLGRRHKRHDQYEKGTARAPIAHVAIVTQACYEPLRANDVPHTECCRW